MLNKQVIIVDDIEEVNCVIHIDFGISAPIINTYTKTVPEYKTTDYLYSFHPIDLKSVSKLDSNISNNKWTLAPYYETTHYKIETFIYITYNKYLKLDARNIKTNEQLLHISLAKNSESDNLDYITPYFIIALERYIKNIIT